MPLHPEISHIATVLEHVKNKSGFQNPQFKISQQNHKDGNVRLHKMNVENCALAIWETAHMSNTNIPKFIKTYLDTPSTQRAFRILDHVSKLDDSLIEKIGRHPYNYGPKS